MNSAISVLKMYAMFWRFIMCYNITLKVKTIQGM